MSRMSACQNMRTMETNPSNFPSYQQPQSVNQQMQTCPIASNVYTGNPQEQLQGTHVQLCQEASKPNFQYPCQTILQNQNPYTSSNPVSTLNIPWNIPTVAIVPNYGQPPPSAAAASSGFEHHSSRGCGSTPIFILPGQQTSAPSTSLPTGYFPVPQTTICCPPASLYPYPIPFPICGYGNCSAGVQKRRSCCELCQNKTEWKSRNACSCSSERAKEEQISTRECLSEPSQLICSKKTCPSSISLQALVSQLLSIQGVVSCTITRLILAKIPGSNVNTSMEETVEHARRSIEVLTKDQLLNESRNAQQVNALINLHMNANPPPSIIPFLTLIQIKLNVLKAQIEALINKKTLECQGVSFEVENVNAIDPQVLLLKTDGELRELLSTLRQRECDERVNVYFSPYRSQRIVAETRLKDVQRKLRQVEVEFERRRCINSSQISAISEIPKYCSVSSSGNVFGESDRRYLESPDPFVITVRNPKRLYLRANVGSPETSYEYPTNDKKPLLFTAEKGQEAATGSSACSSNNSFCEEKTEEVTKNCDTTTEQTQKVVKFSESDTTHGNVNET